MSDSDPSDPGSVDPSLPDAAPALGEVLDDLAGACQRFGRADLRQRVAAAAARCDRPATVICVVGEFKQGKSSLVNGIVGTAICPVDDDLATSAITVVRYADTPGAVVRRRSKGEVVREPVALADLAEYVTEAGNPENRKGVERVEVGVPSRVLAGGLTLVDTPGMGGLGAGHAAATLSFLPFADGLIFVSDVSAELSAPELAFLRQAADLCPSILVVQPKTDIVPAWQQVVEINRGHLARLGLDLPICPVSNELRQTVLATKDRELNPRTGFPDMLAQLADTVIEPAKARAAARSADDGRRAIAQLQSMLDAHRVTLMDATRLAELRARAAEATAHLTQMKGAGARWNVLLSDRITDLSSEVPYRLRAAMRDLTRRMDEHLETLTKGEEWEVLARELQTHAAEAVTEAFVAVEAGRQRIRAEIAELIAADDLDPLTAGPSGSYDVAALWRGKAIDSEGTGKRALGKGLVGLRGAQSGMMLFGMTGQFLPTAAAAFMATNPVLLTAGALFGGFQLLEDRKRKVNARRQAARTQVRTFVDDLQFEVGQELTNLLRSVQRDTRDEFSELIGELAQTWTETLRRAEEDAQRTERERAERATVVERELAGLAAMAAALERAAEEAESESDDEADDEADEELDDEPDDEADGDLAGEAADAGDDRSPGVQGGAA